MKATLGPAVNDGYMSMMREAIASRRARRNDPNMAPRQLTQEAAPPAGPLGARGPLLGGGVAPTRIKFGDSMRGIFGK